VSVAGEIIKVLVVDDSPFMRRAVERMLEPMPALKVVGTASNGREAVEAVQRLAPDVVILDIVMPEVDGLEAIEEIMRARPTPILVLSTETAPGTAVTLRALELGAVDFISKTEAGTRMDIHDLAPIPRERVMGIAGSRVPPALDPPGERSPATPSGNPEPPTERAPYDLVVVGASTGGPRALATFLGGLPADFPAAVLVAQHMPRGFTATLAQRLDRRCAIRVREARDQDRLEPGLALLGVGGSQFQVERAGDDLVARVHADDNGLIHRPSVDLLFTSASTAAADRVIGVVLTGMGQDGAAGLAAIRAGGGRTFAESEQTAVLYGMPRAAKPWAEHVLDLDRLAPAVAILFRQGDP
jgi:two-component system, chemotaxis family, protein-glutamate methylesterase/glutaminase